MSLTTRLSWAAGSWVEPMREVGRLFTDVAKLRAWRVLHDPSAALADAQQTSAALADPFLVKTSIGALTPPSQRSCVQPSSPPPLRGEFWGWGVVGVPWAPPHLSSRPDALHYHTGGAGTMKERQTAEGRHEL